jgi:hypothetical protein
MKLASLIISVVFLKGILIVAGRNTLAPSRIGNGQQIVLDANIVLLVSLLLIWTRPLMCVGLRHMHSDADGFLSH